MPTFDNMVDRHDSDFGPDAALFARVVDSDSNPVTTGTVTLVVASLVTGPYTADGTAMVTVAMTHEGDGVWRWDPAEGELLPGLWRTQVLVNDVRIPANGYGTLLVRRALALEV